jgi:acetyl esterase/lipase
MRARPMADALAAAGVPVVKKRVSGMIHDFPVLSLNLVPEAAEELAAFGAWLKARFASV